MNKKKQLINLTLQVYKLWRNSLKKFFLRNPIYIMKKLLAPNYISASPQSEPREE